MGERSNVSSDFDSVVEASSGIKNNKDFSRIRIRYLIYDLLLCVREFFFGERLAKTREDKLAEKAEQLILDTLNTNLLKQSRQLIEQQRELENTKARQRLERWATKTITWYLVAVFVLIVSNGAVAYYS